jgi:tetraacyldisaccharide 4'-kinase
MVAGEDLAHTRTLPGGRLREPIDAASSADAFVALDGAGIAALSAGRPFWHARRRLGAVPHGPAVAVAGIADPRAFFESVRAAGCTVVREIGFADHYRYSRADVRRLAEQARDAGADSIVTTEKDLVRLLPFRPFSVPIVAIPLTIEIDDSATFDAWLADAIERAHG